MTEDEKTVRREAFARAADNLPAVLVNSIAIGYKDTMVQIAFGEGAPDGRIIPRTRVIMTMGAIARLVDVLVKIAGPAAMEELNRRQAGPRSPP